MVELELFVYNDADKILETKGLLQEVQSLLLNSSRVNHNEIQEMFRLRNWSIEKCIFQNVTWRWDACKDKVGVSIELSLIDAVHRDFLRAILAHKRGDLDVLVYVTSTFKEPRFQNVKRDIEIFKEILTIPILLIGIT
jgi:hypothetical protein